MQKVLLYEEFWGEPKVGFSAQRIHAGPVAVIRFLRDWRPVQQFAFLQKQSDPSGSGDFRIDQHRPFYAGLTTGMDH